MIKKILGILISCFGLINITFGYAYINQVGSNVYPQNNSTIANVDSLLNILRIPNGTETEYNFTYFGTVGVIGRKGNRLYSYDYYQTTNKETQGYVNNIYECTYNTVASNNKLVLNDNISHCEIIGNISSLQNYVGHINYYAVGTMGMGNSYYATVLCFIEEDPTEISSRHHWYCLYPDTSDNEGYNWKSYSIDLINSLNIFNSSPLNGSSVGGNSELPYITQGCNKAKALNWYEKNGYSSRLCYGGLDNFDVWDGSPVGILPVYGTGKDVLSIWGETANKYQFGTTGNTMDYVDWFDYWRMMYNIYKRSGYSSNPFIGNPLVLYTYFGAIDVYGDNLGNDSIIEYCDLKLYTSDYTVTYNGVNKNNVCSVLDYLNDQLNGNTGTGSSSGSGNNNGNYNGSGELIIGLNPIDIIKNQVMSGSLTGDYTGDVFSGDVEIIENPKNFIEKFYSDLEENMGDIANNSFGQGILPIYITIALMGLIVFRFMSH